MKSYNFKADSHPLEEINEKDQESDKDGQQQTTGKNLSDKLPYDILEMILMNVTKSHAVDAFYSISRNCIRFQFVIEGKKMKYYRWFISILQKMFSNICQDEPTK